MTWFKNLAVFKIAPIPHIAAYILGAKLQIYNDSAHSNFPVERYSFTFPAGCNSFAQAVAGNHALLNLCVERKTIPKQVVDRETEKERRKIYVEKGFYPGREMARDIRDSVVTQLCDRAFIDETFYPIWIDQRDGWLGIDTPSQKRAIDAARVLCHALDELGGRYLTTFKNTTPPGDVSRTDRAAMCAYFRSRLNTTFR